MSIAFLIFAIIVFGAVCDSGISRAIGYTLFGGLHFKAVLNITDIGGLMPVFFSARINLFAFTPQKPL